MKEKRPRRDPAESGSAAGGEEPTVLNPRDATITTGGAGSARPDSTGEPLVPGYTLGEKLGEGGMGVVYRATQHEPRREVALKIIRGGGLADELSLRLFRREADTLARLRHPGIAAVFEVGTTRDGQPYLAMELVLGPTLREWLEGATAPDTLPRAALAQRLQMLRSICETVHYAHQRGVIHRDLKPANLVVLAEEPGGDRTASSSGLQALPRVKILDFGLARISDQEGQEQSLLTQAGTIAGTLPYMSPEQATGAAGGVDVRADVYALGVIAYELLTGERPIDVARDPLLEAVRKISEQAPATLAENWRGRGAPDPDLETIVAKALAKQPDERYGSAAALAEDLERYLTSQPILARPASTLYQLRKLVARNRAPFAAAAAVGLLIVGAAVGMGLLYLRSERNLQRAVAAEREARTEAETANRTADFLVDIFGSSDPERTSGESVTARQILDEGAARVESELADEPLLQARMMTTIGRVYRNLALYPEARELVAGGLAIKRRVLGSEHVEVARSLRALGLIDSDLGDVEASRAAHTEAVAILEGIDPSDTEDLPLALSALGTFENEFRELEAADAHLRRSIELIRSGGDPRDPRLVRILNHYGMVQTNAGKPEEALVTLNEALSLAREIFGDRSATTADVLNNLGATLNAVGKPDEAEPVLRELLALREAVYGPDHPFVGQAAGNLAISLIFQGKAAEARPLFEQSLAVTLGVHGPEHPQTAQGQNNLGRLCLDLGELEDARAYLDAALATRIRSLGEAHPLTGVTLYNLADYHSQRGEYDRARDLLERVLAIDERAFGPDHPDIAEDLAALASAKRALGDEPGAAADEARAARIRARAAAGDS